MTEATREDIRSLRADVNNLRTEVTERLRATAERSWAGTKDAAQIAVDEIEERPVVATVLALVVGILIGLMIGTSRR